MTFLPIQFRTKLKHKDFNNLESDGILELIYNYLVDDGFDFVERKNKKIFFYRLGGFTSLKNNFFLVSGEVKILDKKNHLTIINGNWKVFLIAIPFIAIALLAETSFSTFSEHDKEMIWTFFIVIFGGNFLIRIFGHYTFKQKIMDLIKENYTQQRV